MTTLDIPPGTYRIAVARRVGVEAEIAEASESDVQSRVEYLTNAKWITIEPARGAQPNPEQEWRLALRGKGWVIQPASKGPFPPKYITYDGAPAGAEPKEGARVILDIAGFPGPLSAWQFEPVPKAKHTYFIVVAGHKEFGIAIAPQKIHPPFLELTCDPKRYLAWKFENAPLANE